MPDAVLHEDNPDAPGNLSAADYNATYAEGDPCNQIPADVLAAAEADAPNHVEAD